MEKKLQGQLNDWEKHLSEYDILSGTRLASHRLLVFHSPSVFNWLSLGTLYCASAMSDRLSIGKEPLMVSSPQYRFSFVAELRTPFPRSTSARRVSPWINTSPDDISVFPTTTSQVAFLVIRRLQELGAYVSEKRLC